MKTCIVISCCKKKLPFPAPAFDLYQSPRFKRCMALAQKSKLPWFIFSAKHGLILPDTVIEPYDLTLSKQSATDPSLVADPSDVVRLKIKANKILAHYDRRIYLMSEVYCFDLLPGEQPMKGFGLYAQQKWLSKAKLRDIGL